MKAVEKNQNCSRIYHATALVAAESWLNFDAEFDAGFLGAVETGLLECCNLLICNLIRMVGVTGFEPVTSCM
jgi:hypothetical protein